MDWLLEARPSFSPPRRDLRPADSDPGATQYYSQRLDNLNTKYDRLLEQLSQRLKTAIEVNGSVGLVSIYSTHIDEVVSTSSLSIKFALRVRAITRERAIILTPVSNFRYDIQLSSNCQKSHYLYYIESFNLFFKSAATSRGSQVQVQVFKAFIFFSAF